MTKRTSKKTVLVLAASIAAFGAAIGASHAQTAGSAKTTATDKDAKKGISLNFAKIKVEEKNAARTNTKTGRTDIKTNRTDIKTDKSKTIYIKTEKQR